MTSKNSDFEMGRGTVVWGVHSDAFEAACTASAGNLIASTNEGNAGLSELDCERVAWLEYAAGIPRDSWQDKIADHPEVPRHIVDELGLRAVTHMELVGE